MLNSHKIVSLHFAGPDDPLLYLDAPLVHFSSLDPLSTRKHTSSPTYSSSHVLIELKCC